MRGLEVAPRRWLLIALLAILIIGYLLGAAAARFTAPEAQVASVAHTASPAPTGKPQSAQFVVPTATALIPTPATYKLFLPRVMQSHSGD